MGDRPTSDPATRSLAQPVEPQAPWRLILLRGGEVVTRPVERSTVLTIGRGEAADMLIHDDAMSRVHLRIEFGEAVTATDLGSTNGTSVRGVRLEPNEPHHVAPGELVALGTTSLFVESSEIGQAPNRKPESAMARVHDLADRVAPSQIAVLIEGETGVGKEVLARRIHAAAGRSGPFLPINCAALSPTLLESQLFGHEKGAFTGAHALQRGLLETAQDGTVFLDEVGDIPAAVQARLLRTLEDHEVYRVGGTKPVPVQVRFISATNRHLKDVVDAGAFRADLFFRLAGIVLPVAPLRQRVDEIVPLARKFAAQASAARAAVAPIELSAKAEAWLTRQPWDGNVRELRNVVERAVILADRVIEVPDLSLESEAAESTPELTAPQRQERGRIIEALREHAGNQTRAASSLGISRRTLINRIEAYGIPRPRKPR